MEDITLFVAIVIILFGILQIALFFKMWGMTNDVDKISRKLDCDKTVSQIFTRDIRQALIEGDKKKAERILISAFLYDSNSREFEKLKKIYEKYYNKLGLDMPEIIKSSSSINDVFKF